MGQPLKSFFFKRPVIPKWVKADLPEFRRPFLIYWKLIYLNFSFFKKYYILYYFLSMNLPET